MIGQTAFVGLCLVGPCVVAIAGEARSQEGTRGPFEWTDVRVQRKPGRSWRVYPTRVLRDGLPVVDMPRSPYGGDARRRTRATGFFRAERSDGRWWLVDPDGCRFISVGINSVRPPRTPSGRAALVDEFGDPAAWAEATADLLREHGINTLGRWSEWETFRHPGRRMPYTTSLSFMGSFASRLKVARQGSGHLDFRGGVMPVFHPEFAAHCDEYARRLRATRDDPYLIGHFSDNELPVRDLLDRCLALDADDDVLQGERREALRWLRERHGPEAAVDQVDDADREAFAEHVYDRYYAVTTGAIRKSDPNHLCLGSRLYSVALTQPGYFRAAGRHLDVVSVNYYWAWGPDPERLRMWHAAAERPVLITEFYAKGADSGLGNTSGAGWIVPTQRDRGAFYQHFALALLESRTCVGWHWHRYMDNEPGDSRADPSNRDSNKGIVGADFEPYTPLLQAMRVLGHHLYSDFE